MAARRAHGNSPGALIPYAHTKPANLLFTLALSERLIGSRVTVNAVHPGFVRTRFTAGSGSLGWFMRA